MPAEVHAILAAAQVKIDRLHAIGPCLIDVHGRGSVGAQTGLADDFDIGVVSRCSG